MINQLIVQVLCFVKEKKNTLLTHIPENVYSPLLKKNPFSVSAIIIIKLWRFCWVVRWVHFEPWVSVTSKYWLLQSDVKEVTRLHYIYINWHRSEVVINPTTSNLSYHFVSPHFKRFSWEKIFKIGQVRQRFISINNNCYIPIFHSHH